MEGLAPFDDDQTGAISFQNLKRGHELGENLTDEELQEMIDEATDCTYDQRDQFFLAMKKRESPTTLSSDDHTQVFTPCTTRLSPLSTPVSTVSRPSP